MSDNDKNLLIIAEDTSAGAMISRFLRSKGFVIKTSSTAEEALTILDRWQVNLVFLEAHGSGDEALRLLHALRKHRDGAPSGRDAPILLGTGFSWETKTEKEIKGLGVSGIVVNPLENLSYLVSAITKALSQSAAVSAEESEDDEADAAFNIQAPPPSASSSAPQSASPSPQRKASPSPPPEPTQRAIPSPSKESADDSQEPPAPSRDEAAQSVVNSRNGVLEYTRRPLPTSGRLTDMSVAELTYGCHVGGATGTLSLHRGETKRLIFFDKGAPVNVEATDAGATLATILERSGLLSQNQRQDLEATCSSSKKTYRRVLLDKGMVSPHVLFEVLTDQLRERLTACFDWEEGTFSFDHNAGCGEDVVPLNLSSPRIIATGIATHYSLERLEELLPVSDTAKLYLRHDGPIKREALLLTTVEARLFEVAARGESMAQMIEVAGGRDQAFRVLYALFLMELVGVKSRLAQAKGARPPSRRAERRLPSAPRRARVKADEGPSFLKELGRLEDADFFELLGLERGASTDDIHEAFRARVKRYHPDNVGHLSLDVQERGLKLYRRMVEGYQVLANPIKRDEYLRELETSPRKGRDAGDRGEGASKERSKPAGRPARKSAPDELFSQVDVAIEEERYKDALRLLGTAKSEYSHDARCIAWYGWVLYLERPVSDLHEAERQLGIARGLDPEHPEPYLLMARLRAKEGAIEQSRDLYSKARALAPGDHDIATEADQLNDLLHQVEEDVEEESSSQNEPSGRDRKRDLVNLLKRLPFGKRS